MDSSGGKVFLLQHIGDSLQRQFDQTLQEQIGIGTSQYRVLILLKNRPDIPQRYISASLGQTEASISRQMRVLYAKGLTTTYPHPLSKREHVTNLTPKGLLVIEAAQELFEQSSKGFLEDLNSRQRKNLAVLLDNIHQQVCTPANLHACDHQLEIDEEMSENTTYVDAIS